MSQVDMSPELRDIVLSNSSFGPADVQFIRHRLAESFGQFSQLRELTHELEVQTSRSPAAEVRLGVCLFLLGRYRQAAQVLESADGGAMAHFYAGQARYRLEAYDKSIDHYESAKTAGYNADECNLAIADAKRQKGHYHEALSILDNMFGPIEQTAEYLYQRGATIAAIGDNPSEVVALYGRAVDADPQHIGALFGLALENDRRGNDDRAMELYQRASTVFPTSVGVLLNLGLLYEDYEQYGHARRCYDRILEEFPTDARARLYRRDSLAASDEFYDHDRERQREQLAQVLKIPIGQFELSVRSRNCLQKMGIQSLGDLVRITEQDLLASKNFGETSLVEIREMMTNRGLAIGQLAHEKPEVLEPLDTSRLSADEQALLERPIADLNLSVRARKCMSRLGLTTIGELVRKTGDDLLECKNFGVTSLNEVREKLTQIGLRLRGE